MAYSYSGPLGLSVNGFAAFLSGAASYFIPVSVGGVVAEPFLISELNSSGKLIIFLETYGSF
ncbi:MAG: hypothetical protein OEZ48_15875, partial [Candidatus Bathyarchaeota archaeon]|nr:hypothetical protein [Candidatus Bathyarchaeota archaeon]